jgi:hypothetical protein
MQIGGWFVEDKWHEVRGGVDTREVKCWEKIQNVGDMAGGRASS